MCTFYQSAACSTALVLCDVTGRHGRGIRRHYLLVGQHEALWLNTHQALTGKACGYTAHLLQVVCQACRVKLRGRGMAGCPWVQQGLTTRKRLVSCIRHLRRSTGQGLQAGKRRGILEEAHQSAGVASPVVAPCRTRLWTAAAATSGAALDKLCRQSSDTQQSQATSLLCRASCRIVSAASATTGAGLSNACREYATDQLQACCSPLQDHLHPSSAATPGKALDNTCRGCNRSFGVTDSLLQVPAG